MSETTAVHALLEVRALSIGHGGRALLPAFELSLGAGEFWAVVGRNGSGKSTWLRTALGLLPPLAGTLRRAPRLKMTYLPQRGAGDDLYPVTGRDVVQMGCLRECSLVRLPRDASRHVDAALDLMGAGDLADRSFRELSEGQRQRILFARIAASQADIAFLDEPTSALDLVAEREAFELLRKLQRESKMTIVIVSHYVRLVAQYADHALLLDRDTPAVVAGAPETVFLHEAFRARYGTSIVPGRPH
jgi:zinc transport system ATP-binding protein